jgi:hypothetical protein
MTKVVICKRISIPDTRIEAMGPTGVFSGSCLSQEFFDTHSFQGIERFKKHCNQETISHQIDFQGPERGKWGNMCSLTVGLVRVEDGHVRRTCSKDIKEG